MAYNSVANGRAFNGTAAPWAKAFAGVVAEAWVHNGASVVFADELVLTGRRFIVVPKIGRCQIEALALYAPKLDGDKLSRLLLADRSGNFEPVLRDWKQLGRAFVHFCINPSKADPIEVLDHHGSVRFVNELVALDRPTTPTLREFDESLGCSLVEARAECNRLFPLLGFESLPRLPDPLDKINSVSPQGEAPDIPDCVGQHSFPRRLDRRHNELISSERKPRC